MPTKRRASQWQPAGTELLDVSPLYDKAKIRELAKIIRGENLRRCRNALRNILGRLNVSLHYQGRPTGPEKRAAIEAVARPLSELRDALSKLDPDTRELLLVATECDPWNQDVEPDGPDLARSRFNRALNGVESLARWVPRVEEGIEKSKGGRPKQEPIQRAVTDLLEIWTRYAGREPTLGPFLDFCRAALTPLLDKWGIKADLERQVRKALYG